MLKFGKKEVEEILSAFAEQLKDLGVKHLELLVCGGAALNVLDLVSRTTEDVDVIAFVNKDKHGRKNKQDHSKGS